jgi:diguanylate cyclase (GGDEF)-like protein
LILPGSSLDATRMRAEQVRDGMNRVHVEHGGQSLGAMTLSAGVATFPHDGTTAKVVLQAADEALYHAKASGRDRVLTYQSVKKTPQSETSSSHSG